MRTDVLPYLIPAADAWRHQGWHTWDGEEWRQLPTSLPSWDPHSDLRLQAVIAVDLSRVRSEAQLHSATPVMLTVSWTSSSSGVTERAALAAVTDDQPRALELQLPSRRLGGTLLLRTTLTVGAAAHAGPGVASLAGSLLLEHRAEVALEGAGAQFPVAVVDFARSRLHSQASWHLQTSHELEAPFLGAFVLLINSQDSELTQAIASGSPDGRHRALLDQLEEELAALMLALATRASEVLATREWPANSVGAVLAGLLDQERFALDFSAYDDAAEVNSRLAGTVRARGHGRLFP